MMIIALHLTGLCFVVDRGEHLSRFFSGWPHFYYAAAVTCLLLFFPTTPSDAFVRDVVIP